LTGSVCRRNALLVFDYHNSVTRTDRLRLGTDHCGSTGTVYRLADVVREGRIIDPRDSDAFVTTSSERTFIYAVDLNGEMRIGEDGIRGQPEAVKHETLFHNADVAAAGELQIRDGVVVHVNDRSGSYGTSGLLDVDRRFAATVLNSLKLAGAEVEQSEWRRLVGKAGV
jgi:hypothetical protein